MAVLADDDLKVSILAAGRPYQISRAVHDRLVVVAAERRASVNEFVSALASNDPRYLAACIYGHKLSRARRIHALIGVAIAPRRNSNPTRRRPGISER